MNTRLAIRIILTSAKEATEFVKEFQHLAVNSGRPMEGIVVSAIGMGVQFSMPPEALTDEVRDLINHTAGLFKTVVHGPFEI